MALATLILRKARLKMLRWRKVLLRLGSVSMVMLVIYAVYSGVRPSDAEIRHRIHLQHKNFTRNGPMKNPFQVYLPVAPSEELVQSYADNGAGRGRKTKSHKALQADIKPTKHSSNLRFARYNASAAPITQFGLSLFNINLKGLKVYIYSLPKLFNTELSRCATSNTQSAMCFDLTNHGYGKKFWTNKKVTASLTHQFSLEIIFHQKLLKSAFLTTNPSEADLFYVPYYVAMGCFCKGQDMHKLDEKFWDFLLDEQPYLRKGQPHFMALGKVEQEMSSARCPFLQSSHSHFLKYLLIEQTLWPRTRAFFQRQGKENEVIVVPYPSYIHFTQSTGVSLADVGGTNKSMLVVMVGSMKHSRLRETLASQLTASPRGHFVALQPDECWNKREQLASTIIAYVRKATFCLQPPGDTPTRKSFYDTLLCGCIPVTFVEGLKYPFDDVFNYTSFTVNIREKDVLEKQLNVVDMLNAIPPRKVAAMQGNLARVMWYLQYGSYHHGEDAVTTVLRKLVYEHKIQKFLPPALLTS